MARSRRKDYSNRLRFSRTNYKASCRREIFSSPAACRTKAFNKHFVSNINLNRHHFCIFPISIRISCRSGLVFEQEYKSNLIISNPFFRQNAIAFSLQDCVSRTLIRAPEAFAASEIAFLGSVPMPLLRTFSEAAVQAGIDISDFGHSFVPI